MKNFSKLLLYRPKTKTPKLLLYRPKTKTPKHSAKNTETNRFIKNSKNFSKIDLTLYKNGDTTDRFLKNSKNFSNFHLTHLHFWDPKIRISDTIHDHDVPYRLASPQCPQTLVPTDKDHGAAKTRSVSPQGHHQGPFCPAWRPCKIPKLHVPRQRTYRRQDATHPSS